MVAEFRLDDVKQSPAFFDVQKLDHINGEYLRALPVETFIRDSLPWLEVDPPWPPEQFSLETFSAIAPAVQERVNTLSEVPSMVDFFFLAEPKIDEASWAKAMKAVPVAGELLDAVINDFENCDWDAETLHHVAQAAGERFGLKLNRAQAPVRVAVTGRSVGPPLFESLVVLGRGVTLDRLRAARRRLE
jgi:glutamyl-tRNA synthetase